MLVIKALFDINMSGLLCLLVVKLPRGEFELLQSNSTVYCSGLATWLICLHPIASAKYYCERERKTQLTTNLCLPNECLAFSYDISFVHTFFKQCSSSQILCSHHIVKVETSGIAKSADTLGLQQVHLFCCKSNKLKHEWNVYSQLHLHGFFALSMFCHLKGERVILRGKQIWRWYRSFYLKKNKQWMTLSLLRILETSRGGKLYLQQLPAPGIALCARRLSFYCSRYCVLSLNIMLCTHQGIAMAKKIYKKDK